jgi:RHS repeat-associated protein
MTSDGTHSYTWDAHDHLSAIDSGGTATFIYDAFGRRVSKTILSTQTGFLFDGANPVQELSGATVTANSLTGSIDEMFQRADSSGARSFLTDIMGSSIALTDSTGTIQTQYGFEPFGNTTVSGASTTNTFAYAGRELDATGLYFNRSRYYNPILQWFISADPLDILGGDINLYAYVGNEPTDFTDPFGTNRYHCDWEGHCYKKPLHGRGGCRKPDFRNFTLSAGPGIGVQVSISISKDGNTYVGIGPQAGKSPSFIGVSGTNNWMANQPTPQQLDNYLSGPNVSNTVGAGLAITQGAWPGSGQSVGSGLATPQVGTGATYSVTKDTAIAIINFISGIL